jgi:hypothetical protein
MPSTAAMTWNSPVLPPPTTGLAWPTYKAATAVATGTGTTQSGSRRSHRPQRRGRTAPTAAYNGTRSQPVVRFQCNRKKLLLRWGDPRSVGRAGHS